jgi:hypothetical protein
VPGLGKASVKKLADKGVKTSVQLMGEFLLKGRSRTEFCKLLTSAAELRQQCVRRCVRAAACEAMLRRHVRARCCGAGGCCALSGCAHGAAGVPASQRAPRGACALRCLG